MTSRIGWKSVGGAFSTHPGGRSCFLRMSISTSRLVSSTGVVLEPTPRDLCDRRAFGRHPASRLRLRRLRCGLWIVMERSETRLRRRTAKRLPPVSGPFVSVCFGLILTQRLMDPQKGLMRAWVIQVVFGDQLGHML